MLREEPYNDSDALCISTRRKIVFTILTLTILISVFYSGLMVGQSKQEIREQEIVSEVDIDNDHQESAKASTQISSLTTSDNWSLSKGLPSSYEYVLTDLDTNCKSYGVSDCDQRLVRGKYKKDPEVVIENITEQASEYLDIDFEVLRLERLFFSENNRILFFKTYLDAGVNYCCTVLSFDTQMNKFIDVPDNAKRYFSSEALVGYEWLFRVSDSGKTLTMTSLLSGEAIEIARAEQGQTFYKKDFSNLQMDFPQHGFEFESGYFLFGIYDDSNAGYGFSKIITQKYLNVASVSENGTPEILEISED
ncbi:MAG: hypothetical protein ACI92I_000866 [Acidimicrobiales bacterium]|jgi:hypothetical protein